MADESDQFDRSVARQALEELRRSDPRKLTLRDEANALTLFAFRNGYLENIHAGQSMPIPPEYSRISQAEMRQLMIEASGKLEAVLRLKQDDPIQYEILIRDLRRTSCKNWVRE